MKLTELKIKFDGIPTGVDGVLINNRADANKLKQFQQMFTKGADPDQANEIAQAIEEQDMDKLRDTVGPDDHEHVRQLLLFALRAQLIVDNDGEPFEMDGRVKVYNYIPYLSAVAIVYELVFVVGTLASKKLAAVRDISSSG